jgi:putative membrane protein
MYLILRWIINALLLMLVPYLVNGVVVANFYTALIAALVLALVNAVIRPFLVLLTLPVNILTLGLFTLIINAVLFWFVGTAVKGFTVTGFWPAFWAALIYSVLSVIINHLLSSKK